MVEQRKEKKLQKEIINKLVYVWGTGKYAKNFMERLDAYEDYCCLLGVNLSDSIVAFIDGNVDKQGKEFYQKPIISVDEAVRNGMTTCIVAVLDHSEIDKVLEEKNIVNNYYYEEYLSAVKNTILEERGAILSKDKIGLSTLMRNTLEIAERIDKWKKTDKQKAYFDKLCLEYSDEDIVAAFSWFFGNDIIFLSDFFTKLYEKKNTYEEIRTIGIMADRFYGGGIEKVLALLMPLLEKDGFRIILITDECEPSKDFQISETTIRYHMHNDHDALCYNRIRELGECVNKYGIDVMCFHFGYTRISSFYEMLYLKMKGMPIIMELHSNYIPIVQNKEQVSKYFPYMYRIANRIVVLSRADADYWSGYGCNCTYIQNPIEDKKQSPNFHKFTKTVIWVGRIVQQPKQIMDVIPIMKEVTKVIPDAKLLIIGNPDSDYVIRALRHGIIDSRLENQIEICPYSTRIDEYYQRADIMLVTSANESFSNVIQESKVYGIPMVMYKLPWLELIRDGKGFIAVDQNDTEAAGRAIVRILSEKKLRERMAIEARESILPFLTHDVCGDWKRLFEEIQSS